jgi:hypothetical protein
VLPSRLILFDLTFSLVPGPLFLLASVAFKVSGQAGFKNGEVFSLLQGCGLLILHEFMLGKVVAHGISDCSKVSLNRDSLLGKGCGRAESTPRGGTPPSPAEVFCRRPALASGGVYSGNQDTKNTCSLISFES